MKTRIKEYLIFVLARYRRSRLFKVFYRLAIASVKGFENYSYNHRLNGEDAVLKCLKKICPLKTIFDVGAHEGHWTQNVLKLFPEAAFYCFEIQIDTFQSLQANLGGQKSVKLFSYGLAEKSGKIHLNFDPSRNAQTTMFQPSVPGNFSTHEAEVFSGQAVCDQLNISQIDFLKIDVEGAEHLVLKGFGDMLSTNQIKIIQFEYGECNKITRFLLGDFYDLLCKRGYIVGKIFPYGVEFKDYKIRDDDFIGPNYLAVLESEKKIIEKLRNF